MRSTRTRIGAALVVALALGLVAACGDDDDGGGGDAATDGDDVTISVSNLPPETEPETREAFLTRVEEFEAANPNITIDAQEWEWDVTTFGSQLAGDTLPTTFEIPFTYGPTLVEGIDCIATSYPDFVATCRALAGEDAVEVVA